MGLVHRQQIAEPAAIFPSEPFPAQRPSAKSTFFCRLSFFRISFPVLFPPFDPAGVAANPSLLTRAPFRLELPSAVWADLLWPGPLPPFFQHLLLMISLPALVAAEPPPPPRAALLLFYFCSAFRADIYRHTIMPFCVVVPIPTGITAKFLPRDVAGRYELFPAIQAV